MSAVALETPARPVAHTTVAPERASSKGSRVALGVSATGLTLLLAAVALFGTGRHASRAGAAQSAPVPARGAITSPEVGVAQVVYEPGHTSGWHVHSGVHSVVVLAGTLTVYDESCHRQEFLPGQMYLGGNQPHVARNEGANAAELAVTYVYTAKADPGHTTAPPAGCTVR